jgi:Arc/MetJ family transcription regulator
VNGKVDAAQTAKVMQEFARQNEFMNMKEDMIGDALQDAVRIHTGNRR